MNIDSILNKSILFLLILLLAVSLVIGSFFFEPFVFGADSLSPLTVVSSTPSYNDIVASGTLIYNTGSFDVYSYASADNVFVVYNSALDVYYGVAETSGSKVYRNNSSNVLTLNLNTYNSTYSLYYNQIGNGGTSYCSAYDSLDSCLSAVRDYIDNPPILTYDALYDGFSIPRGYLARLTFNEYYEDIPLSTVFPNKSKYSGTPWPLSSQWYSVDHTGLTTIPSVISSGGTSLSWSVSGDTTWTGQGYNGSCSVDSGVSDTGCLYICNPVYQQAISDFWGNYEQPNLNGSITLSDPDGYISSIRLYSLSSVFNTSSGAIDISLSTDSDSYEVNGSTSGAFTYQPLNSSSSAVSSPTVDGGTYVDYSQATNNDIVSTIRNAFNDLVSRLESILHPSVGYFQTIINSFQGFVSWMTNLWSWLPSPIVSLIEAVLYISILVGLIKFIF